jgi:Ca2+-transporting ATPase
VLTWAGVELAMLQRLLETTSLTSAQWLTVIALSLLAPAVVAVDRLVERARHRAAPDHAGAVADAAGAYEGASPGTA